MRRRALRLGERTLVMGVVNITPDSFSDGGLYLQADAAIEHSLRLLHEGADLLDLGVRGPARATPARESARPSARRRSRRGSCR